MTRTTEIVITADIRVGDVVMVPSKHVGSYQRYRPDADLTEADGTFKRVVDIEQNGPGFAFIISLADGDLYNWPPDAKTLREVAIPDPVQGILA